MKIAFYKAWNGTWVDKLISLVTLSKYSHCEIVFSDGLCASSSARDGGVRFAQINLNSGNWDVFDLDMGMNYDETRIRQWFINNDGDTYDWPAAIQSVFGVGQVKNDKKFCSQACAIVLDFYPAITPGKLYSELIKYYYIHGIQ